MRPRSHGKALRWIRWLTTGVVTIAAVALATVPTLGGITRDAAPALAARYGGGDGFALANVAELQLAVDPSERGLAVAERLAQQAVVREPLAASAYRVLGAVADSRGENALASRRYDHAQLLSRRDLRTTLWLAQARVKAGDWGGALMYLEQALRVRPRGRTMIYPIMMASLAYRSPTRSLAQLLATAPPWRDDFLAMAASRAPLPGVAALLQDLRARGGTVAPAVSGAFIRTSVSRGEFALAAREYRTATGRTARGGLRNGGFDAQPAFPPLDWSLATHSDASSGIARAPGTGDSALLFRWRTEGDRVLARQLLLLPPGRYRLTGRTRLTALQRATAPEWMIQCTGSERTLSSTRVGERTGDWVRFAATFSVPAGCEAQWLTLAAGAGRPGGEVEGYADSLALARLAGTA